MESALIDLLEIIDFVWAVWTCAARKAIFHP